MNSRQLIEAYESLIALMERMRGAADRGEWDNLIALEQRFRSQVAAMPPVEELPDEASRQRLMELIRKILEDGSTIRGHTETWLAQLQNVMRSNRQEQNLNRTYYGIK